MAAMTKRDPDRHAELHREKGRQLVAEARAAREMSRAGASAQGPDAQAMSATAGGPRGDAAR
jgi:hypothetical protein